MLWKKSLKNRSPKIPRSVSDPVFLKADYTAVTTKEFVVKPRVAVFVTHGMGQQVPFETLDAVAEGLAQAADRRGNLISGIQASTVQIGGTKTQRAEFKMRTSSGGHLEVHVYEGYWAPFTEGQVALRDVMSFLLRAGVNGLLNSCDFQRWIFGRVVSFGRNVWAALLLLAALGVVLSLMVLNLSIAVVSGDRLLNKILDRTTEQPIISDAIFPALTSVAGIFAIYSLCFGILMATLCWKKWYETPSKSTTWKAITGIAQLFLWGWVILTIASGVAILLLITHCLSPELVTISVFNKYWLLIWAGLLITSWAVRHIIIQYPGDVAAYISTHTLDRFNDIRTRIKTKVFEVAKAIYSQDYEHIVMLGHSLGSVVIYDTLNTLINDDVLESKRLNIVDRTKLLLTFGSPLDKTAFIFASQWANTTTTREALAASLQPFILKYVPFRDIKWINVYSPRDIVSGRLEFYDDQQNPNSNGRTVINVQDSDATIPLVAHAEYWRNRTLFDQIYTNL